MTKRYVYFIRPVGQAGPIKIGCSALPEQRLETLMTWSPFPLEVVTTIEGGYPLEQLLHKCFAHAHTHHEWFSPTADLVAAIARIASGIPIEEAVDLSKATGSIRPARKPATEERRRYLSYVHKMRHACNRAAKARGERTCHLPAYAYQILSDWGGCSYPTRYRAPVAPTTEDLAFLDRIAADPVNLCLTFSQRYAELPHFEAAS